FCSTSRMTAISSRVPSLGRGWKSPTISEVKSERPILSGFGLECGNCGVEVRMLIASQKNATLGFTAFEAAKTTTRDLQPQDHAPPLESSYSNTFLYSIASNRSPPV